MQLAELKKALASHPDKSIQFVLPTGTKIPLHSHVTDVARIEKRFIDCGGTFRTEVSCRMQTWFSNDTEHRISAATLLKILQKASSFLETEDLDVEVEHEAPFISQFPISHIDAAGDMLMGISWNQTHRLSCRGCLRSFGPEEGSKYLQTIDDTATEQMLQLICKLINQPF